MNITNYAIIWLLFSNFKFKTNLYGFYKNKLRKLMFKK